MLPPFRGGDGGGLGLTPSQRDRIHFSHFFIAPVNFYATTWLMPRGVRSRPKDERIWQERVRTQGLYPGILIGQICPRRLSATGDDDIEGSRLEIHDAQFPQLVARNFDAVCVRTGWIKQGRQCAGIIVFLEDAEQSSALFASLRALPLSLSAMLGINSGKNVFSLLNVALRAPMPRLSG